MVERGQQTFGRGDKLVVVVAFKTHERIVHAETVVTHGALKIVHIHLLAAKAFEDIEKLVGGAVESVIECDLVHFAALFVAKCFLSEIGDAAVDVEIHAVEIMKLRGELKDSVNKRAIDFKWLRTRLLVELANVVGRAANFAYL